MGHIKYFLTLIIFFSININCFATQPYIIHKKVKVNGHNSVVNAIFFDENYKAQITYGNQNISKLTNVKNFVQKEKAIAGINASYFKPDTGTPLGLSIINNKIITGPLLKRSCFGIKDNKYYIDNVEFKGKIKIGNKKINLRNINQPITSLNDVIIYDKNWGKKTPQNPRYNTIGVKDNKITLISGKNLLLENIDYALLIPKNQLIQIKNGQKISVSYKLFPKIWNEMDFAIAAGPCLIKDGCIKNNGEHFSSAFWRQKAPRSAIGTTSSGQIALITVDGRQKNSKGISLYKFAEILKELKVNNALNLDGGSSTQFIYKDRLQNNPSVKGGAVVTNAIIIKKKTG